MAPAQIARASANSDSIKGLAQSIAKPAYRRLLFAEPVLRRAVPVLIIAFLITMAIGAGVQVQDHRRQTLASLIIELELIAEHVTERVERSIGDAGGSLARRIQDALDRTTHSAARRQILVTDDNGAVIASLPRGEGIGRQLLGILGPDQPLTSFANSGVVEMGLADGMQALASVHHLKAPLGQIAVISRSGSAAWRSDSALTITLCTTTGFVVLILGFAFYWQASRAREADLIHDAVSRRIDTALNRGRCGLWDWDVARGRIFWSHSMFAMLGLEPRDALLTFGEVSALVHPHDLELYEIAAQIADGKTQSIDRAFRMRHVCGDWVWLRVRCEMISPRAEADPHLIGIAVDISEQKSLAEKTLAADLRLRDAIETIPEAFVLWDADNRLVLCNSNFQELHGLADAAVRPGTPCDAVLSAGHKPVLGVKSTGNNDRSAPGARTFEAQLEDGRWLHVSERRTKDGGYVSVGTDITAIKRHEQKLVESEQRLRATVADLRASQQALRTQAQELAELAQKYAEQKTRAEDANQAKSKFLANMSHELRTPLNAIIGFSEIMESGLFGPLGVDRYDEYCRDIRASGQYLLEVINDILDMSKIEAGRLRLDYEQVEFDRIFADALRVVSGRARDKKLTLAADIAPGIRFQADRRALKQIALNLLSNAVKFTREGGRVSVRARGAANHVVLAIADTGIGIPRDALKTLGRPFEQVENQLTRSHEGSGLGLAIAKSLVELHHGTMRIRSKPSKGTIVWVRLPLDGRCAGAEAVTESARPVDCTVGWL